ncbi:Ferredoxin-dependent glutamate synthase [hydrothermal vent metagenome]|uniref:Ferredoxin-dependent glutamate synthase n=1 Tax=hydrothermal vent metagenome TaxID=652676 RepID=A0A3B1CB36_9ZZZZ
MQDMMMSGILMSAMDVMSLFFISLVGILVLVIAVVFVIDISQTKHAIRRNYPVIGRFRYLFEHLGEFFRQYFFAMDREELPFNRALRSWVYRAAKNLSNTRAFGSTRDLTEPGSVIFVNCTFPKLEQDAVMPQSLVIGPDCEQPYETDSLVNVSGMSYGALSRPAVLALSRGAYKAGCWMNTGEGGLSPWHLEGGADLVFQIGTAKYGVRDQAGQLDDEKLREVAAHPQVRMFEIKLSQGAKPGKGGMLPAAKVTPEIAQIRGIPPFTDSISPNRHPDIGSVEDLVEMIRHVRRVTGKPVGFKLVLGGCGHLDMLLQLIVKQGLDYAPDFITVDGAEGGSGAAPMPLMDNVGLPLHESLPLLVDKLNEYGLRERIRVIASGKLVTPGSVAWALCVGADFITSARGFLFALGCIQAMQCNRNTCPTGITTHNPRLQKGLNPEDKALRVENYVHNLVHEVGLIAHSCGVSEPRELRRQHARIISHEGLSVPMDKVYPETKPPLAG